MNDEHEAQSDRGSAGTASLVDQFITALNDHDAAAAAGLMTDDAVYTEWRGEEWVTIKGQEAIRELFEGFNDWSSDFTLAKTFAVLTNQSFAVEYSETGTQDRGPNPTGRRFDLRNVMVGEVRDDKICRMTDYSDVTAYRAQTSGAEHSP